MKTLRMILLIGFAAFTSSRMAAWATGSKLVLTSDQELSATSSISGGAKTIRKQTFNFVGDSSTGTIPTLNFGLTGRIEKVVYVATAPSPQPSVVASTAPTNSTLITVLDPDSSIDVLEGRAKITTGFVSQEYYPFVSPSPGAVSSVPPLLANPAAQMSITGNSAHSAIGEVIIYSGDADWQ